MMYKNWHPDKVKLWIVGKNKKRPKKVNATSENYWVVGNEDWDCERKNVKLSVTEKKNDTLLCSSMSVRRQLYYDRKFKFVQKAK